MTPPPGITPLTRNVRPTQPIKKHKPRDIKLNTVLSDYRGKLGEIIDNLDILKLNSVGWEDVRNYPSLKIAVAAITPNQRTLLVSTPVHLAKPTTVPSHISLWVLQGGSFSGAKLTVNGSFEAGLYQVFKGGIEVSFGSGSVKEFYPQWWGAVGDGVTDDTAEIQATIDSLIDGATLSFPQGRYICSDQFDFVDLSDITIKGYGAILDFSASVGVFGDDGSFLLFSGSVNNETDITAISGNEITVSTLSPTIEVGDWLYINSDEIIDDSFTVSRPYYLKGQHIKVASVNAETDTITISEETPLIYTLTINGFSQKVQEINWAENISIEGIKIELNAVDDVVHGGIRFLYAKDFRVSSVSINHVSRYGILTRRSVLGTISNITSTPSLVATGSLYGVYLIFSNQVTVSDCAMAHHIDGRTSYYIIISNNVLDGAVREHGSLYWRITGNIMKDNSLMVRAGRSILSNNTFYSTRTDASRGLFLSEMAVLFGDVEIRDNHIEWIKETKLGTEDDEGGIYGVSPKIHDIKIIGNTIKNFATGINIDGSAPPRTAKNLIIKDNTIITYQRGILASRMENTLIENNYIEVVTHGSYTPGDAIYLSSSGEDAISEYIIKNNVIKGDFLYGFHIPTDKYSNIRFYDNEISDDVTTKISSASTINYARGGDLAGSATWNPGSIADGDEEMKEVTATGAVLGDFAIASFSLDVADLVLNAQVTASNTVTCILANNTGDAVDLAEGTVYVKVIKK